MVRHPQRDFGDAGGKFFNLDAVELIDIDLGIEPDIGDKLITWVKLSHDLIFDQANFAIGDNQKITASAGWIKKRQTAQPIMKLFKSLLSSIVAPCDEAC